MKQYSVDLYQICENGGPQVQNDQGGGGVVLGTKINTLKKKFSSRIARLRCLKSGV